MMSAQLARELPSSFYDQLTQAIESHNNVKKCFEEAIHIGQSLGFTDAEIAQAIKDYMKDKIPKTTLQRWTAPLLPSGPNGSIRREESSTSFVNPNEEQEDKSDSVSDTPTFQTADKVETGIVRVKVGEALTTILNARNQGVLTGRFFWESDKK